jgi:hypothetical protein
LASYFGSLSVEFDPNIYCIEEILSFFSGPKCKLEIVSGPDTFDVPKESVGAYENKLLPGGLVVVC